MWAMDWLSSDGLGEREVDIRVPFQSLLVVGRIFSNPLLNQKGDPWESQDLILVKCMCFPLYCRILGDGQVVSHISISSVPSLGPRTEKVLLLWATRGSATLSGSSGTFLS